MVFDSWNLIGISYLAAFFLLTRARRAYILASKGHRRALYSCLGMDGAHAAAVGTVHLPSSVITRLIATLLAAAGFMFACGPRTPNPVASANPREEAERGLVSHVMVDTAGGAVRFAIEVTNESRRRVELQFPDGRTHDFAVLDAEGRELWRWSAGRLFTQTMQARLLDAHGSVRFDEPWRNAAPGEYTLVAQLRSDNFPVQQRVTFALR